MVRAVEWSASACSEPLQPGPGFDSAVCLPSPRSCAVPRMPHSSQIAWFFEPLERGGRLAVSPFGGISERTARRSSLNATLRPRTKAARATSSRDVGWETTAPSAVSRSSILSCACVQLVRRSGLNVEPRGGGGGGARIAVAVTTRTTSRSSCGVLRSCMSMRCISRALVPLAVSRPESAHVRMLAVPDGRPRMRRAARFVYMSMLSVSASSSSSMPRR